MADWTSQDLYTPTQNREMAKAHASAVRGRVDRRAVGVSMFTFYASIIALGIFIFANMADRDTSPRAAASEEGVAGEQPAAQWGSRSDQRLAQSDEPDQLAQAQLAGGPQEMDFFETGENDPYAVNAFNFGDPLSEWFNDEEGGWGVPWMPSSGGAESTQGAAEE